MHTEINEGQRQDFSNVIIGRAGNADALRSRTRLKARRDIDAVAKEITSLHHHIADVHADPKFNVTVRWHLLVSFCQSPLRLDGALNSVNGAAELGQHAIASGIGNPAPVGRNQAIKDGAPSGQSLEGFDLVGPLEAAVSLYVSRKNRDQPALSINRFRQNTPLDPAGSLSRD